MNFTAIVRGVVIARKALAWLENWFTLSLAALCSVIFGVNSSSRIECDGNGFYCLRLRFDSETRTILTVFLHYFLHRRSTEHIFWPIWSHIFSQEKNHKKCRIMIWAVQTCQTTLIFSSLSLSLSPRICTSGTQSRIPNPFHWFCPKTQHTWLRRTRCTRLMSSRRLDAARKYDEWSSSFWYFIHFLHMFRISLCNTKLPCLI